MYFRHFVLIQQYLIPSSQVKAFEIGQQLCFGGWGMYKSLDKTWDGGFLQVEQSQISWNRMDAS